MLMMEERTHIIEFGKKILSSGLTKGTGGNLSICNREQGLFAITPSGIDYFKIRPEDIVILDLTGKVVEGTKKPSSETEMHRIFYERRFDIDAMIHTHTMFATTIACMGMDLPAVHYMIAVAGTDVRCAPYATFGTPELALNAFDAMRDRKAVLLANHGLLAGGRNLAEAFNVTEEIEYVAEIYWRTLSVGRPVILPQDEMERMLVKFEHYGQK